MDRNGAGQPLSAAAADAPASQLQRAMAALEGQRELLGDAAVDIALSALRARQPEARAIAPEMSHSLGVANFSVRVGIDSGQVLLGAGIDAHQSIRGNTVNLAARLEQCAPVGGLRISHSTYRQLRQGFEVVRLPAIELKGLGAPVRSYQVLQHRPMAPLLALAHQRLQQQATNFSDPAAPEQFLHAVPHHLALPQRWAQRAEAHPATDN